MGTPVAFKEDAGIPLLQQDGERAVEDLRGGREVTGGRKVRADGLEERLRLRLHSSKGLHDKRHKPCLVIRSNGVISPVLVLVTALGSTRGREVGGGGRVDDGDVNMDEVVREVQLQVRVFTRESQIRRLKERGNPP